MPYYPPPRPPLSLGNHLPIHFTVINYKIFVKVILPRLGSREDHGDEDLFCAVVSHSP